MFCYRFFSSLERHLSQLELLKGLVKVDFEAVKELFIVGTTLSQQFFGCGPGALLL